MSDLVSRLRERAASDSADGYEDKPQRAELDREAADVIERLQRFNDFLIAEDWPDRQTAENAFTLSSSTAARCTCTWFHVPTCPKYVSPRSMAQQKKVPR